MKLIQSVLAARRWTGGLYMVDVFSTPDRALLALAENMDRDPLFVVCAEVWYAANGNVRQWNSLSDPVPPIPCIFDADLETGEATGTVAPFCSEPCRTQAGGNSYLGFKRATLGTSHLNDFGYDPHCEECGKAIGSFVS